MIVVAIIAILAIVVIPSFIKESKRGKARSEVDPMFAELSTREEQYKVEKSSYLAMAACPATSVAAGTDITTASCATSTTGDWYKLRVQAPQSKLTCSYAVVIGNSGVQPSGVTGWPGTWAGAPASAPALSWYFITATCPNTNYIFKSWDTKIKSQDGH